MLPPVCSRSPVFAGAGFIPKIGLLIIAHVLVCSPMFERVTVRLIRFIILG